MRNLYKEDIMNDVIIKVIIDSQLSVFLNYDTCPVWIRLKSAVFMRVVRSHRQGGGDHRSEIRTWQCHNFH